MISSIIHVLFALLISMPVMAEYGRVELVRDEWGVPHVFAVTDEGAMYGLGYAVARDRGFQMHYQLRMIQGRSAEVLGEVLKLRPRGETSIDHDRKMRTFGFYRAAQEVADNLDAETAALLAAYSRGVNDFFAANSLHPLYEKVGLVPELWTPADCIASWWQVGQFFGTDGTRDLISYRNLAERRQRANPLPPYDEAAAVVQREDVGDEWVRQTEEYLAARGFAPPARSKASGANGPKFSHAWVVGGSKSTTGAAVLVSDPQTPVSNPSLFYEFHIRGQSFDARGIGVPGSPLILIGFSREVAWGVTALGADQADLFRLRTDAARPEEYFFDGAWHKMVLRRETIKVKGGEDLELVVRETRFGPVVTAFAFAQEGDPQVALKRLPIAEKDRDTIHGALAMLRARDAASFDQALEGWRFPSVNAVFGDKQGNIGYRAALALPLRSTQAPQLGQAAHDGSAVEFDWQEIVPHVLMPHAYNPRRGYLYSGNHRPIGSFYRIPLTNISGSWGHTLRSWRLAERLGATERFAPEQVLDIHYDAVNPARREIVRFGYYMRDELEYQLGEGAAAALAYLEPWYAAGSAQDLTLQGAELALHINLFFRAGNTDLAVQFGGGETGLIGFLRSLGARIDAGSAAFSEEELTYVERTLSAAWAAAEKNYGRDRSNWPQRAREAVTEQRLGYFTGLHGFPSLDPLRDLALPALETVDGATIRSQKAQAYTQFVSLDDVDRAQSILPMGNSEDPSSPFHLATRDLWAQGALHPAPLSRSAVAAFAVDTLVLEPDRSTAVEEAAFAPPDFALAQNHPNPFNAQTTIEYRLPEAAGVEMTIYTVGAQVLRHWRREHEAAGVYELNWDGRDEKGREVASGTYLYRLDAGSFSAERKMTIVR